MQQYANTNLSYPQPYHVYIPPGYTYPTNNGAQGQYHQGEYAPAYKDPNTFRDSRSNMQYYSSHAPAYSVATQPGSQNRPVPHPPGHTPFPQIKQIPIKTPVSKSQTLKPALKKPKPSNSDVGHRETLSLQRTRTNSDGRQRLTPMTRSRTNSNAAYLPDHLFVALQGTNELRLHGVAFQDTLDVIKENVLPMWPPGIASQLTNSHSYRVTFSRNPWSARGLDGIIAQRMIREIFTRLARQGYQYLCSVTSGYPVPQLVFQNAEPDEFADFFVAYFSSSGYRMRLIKPPRHIGEQLGPRLKNAWPYKIASDRVTEDEIYTLELKRNSLGAPELDKSVFASHALQEINTMGYRLVATVPLARSGLLGFGSKKEVWVFRGRLPQHTRTSSRSGRSR